MTKEDIAKELARINSTIPPLMKKYVTTETKLTPTMEMVMDKALESDDITPEKKAQIKQLKDSGYFTKVKVSENPRIAKLIDQYVQKEIKKSVKAGRLPNKKQLKEIMDKENENKK